MNVSGHEEERVFVDSMFYKTNVRAGTTLVEISDKSKRKIIWGKKGT